MGKSASTGGRANWAGAAFELRLGVQFCVYILLGEAAGLEPGVPRLVQLQAPEPVDDLVLEFENGNRWAVQAKAGSSVRVGWNPDQPFGRALYQLYEGATSGQIDLAPTSSDRVELAVDHRAHHSIIAFGEWLDKARHHHNWDRFAAASSGVEQEWVQRLPTFLKTDPGDDLLAFLRKLHVRRAPTPDEWWSILRGRLIGAAISDSDTAAQILDILLAQVAEAAQYAGQLNVDDLRCACQGVKGIARPAKFSVTQAQLYSSPTNLQQAIAPLGTYIARLTIVALVILPPLVFLTLKWYFFPPDTVIEGLAWAAPTIGIWAAFLANLAQFTGFSLRDIWSKADLRTRWLKTMTAIAFILGSILLLTILLVATRWANLIEQQSQLIYSDEIVILVAEFSEGASYEIPPDRTITHKILGGLEELKVRDPRIVIVKLDQVILDPDTAVILGRERGAVAVIWGVYTSSPTSVLVEPHLKLVSPSIAVFAEGYLTEPEERAVDIEKLHSFKLHLELQREMAYLSSFVAGLAHYSEERLDEALADFDAALEFATDGEYLGTESVYYYRGLILRQQGKYAEAEKQFKKSIAINPTFAEAYNGLGLTYRAQGRTDEAVGQYLKAIEVDPRFASAYNNLAVAYGVQDKPIKDRIELYLKALEIEPDNFFFHQNLGSLYHDQGRNDEALAEYQKAIQVYPYDADSYFYLAYLYYKLARWEEAKEACQKALELVPDHASVHNLLGVLYSDTGNSRQAIAEYRKALAINPDHASAHSNLGLQYEYEGKLEQARAEYEAALRLDPDNPTDHCRLGGLHVKRGQLEEGNNLVAECEGLVAVDPEDPQGHNELGMAYMAMEEYSQALQEFQQAIQLDPDNHTYHGNLSSAYEELGQIQEAIEEAEIALRLYPDPFTPHLQLLTLRWTSGDYCGAARELTLTMRTAPISLKLVLALDLAAFVGMGYMLYILKDRQRRTKAFETVALLNLKCALAVVVTIKWGLAKVHKSLQRFRRELGQSFVAQTLTKVNHLLAVIYHSLANISLLEGQEKYALEKLQKALDVDSTYAPAAQELVSFHANSGNLSTACRFAQQAIKANPRDAVMHIKLGDIYMAWNMIEEAIHEWEQAVKTDVDAVVSFRFNNLRFDPLYIPAHFTLGLAFGAKGEIGKALTGFEATISSTHNHILRHIAEQKIQMLQAEESKSDG